MKILAVIPARYASARLPGKPLAMIGNKSMIERVYEQVKKAKSLDEVIVATDDQRIYDHVLQFGGKAQMTSTTHQSGTSRCIEVAEKMTGYDVMLNIQGDEPFIKPAQIETLTALMQTEIETPIATLAIPILQSEKLFNENVVKVVIDQNNRALYFSRQPIPFIRNVQPEDWLSHGKFYKHIGMYAFRHSVLMKIKSLKSGMYFELEKLEQLQWLENGFPITIGITQEESLGIDTPEDLTKANSMTDDQQA